ncbi:MAG: VanZ family protein [Desulfobacteraceae bacterium]|nr:VanZ family protein [Desulfobacteraceae bacterium]
MDQSSKKALNRLTLNLFYRLPVFILCGLIFWQSSFPSLLDQTLFFHSDKIVHAVVYAALAFLIARNLKKEKPLWSSGQIRSACIALAGLYGISDEIHQYFVASRICSIQDIMADGIGSIAGSMIYLDIPWGKK